MRRALTQLSASLLFILANQLRSEAGVEGIGLWDFEQRRGCRSTSPGITTWYLRTQLLSQVVVSIIYILSWNQFWGKCGNNYNKIFLGTPPPTVPSSDHKHTLRGVLLCIASEYFLWNTYSKMVSPKLAHSRTRDRLNSWSTSLFTYVNRECAQVAEQKCYNTSRPMVTTKYVLQVCHHPHVPTDKVQCVIEGYATLREMKMG